MGKKAAKRREQKHVRRASPARSKGASYKYGDGIRRTKDRVKKYGEVFTPPELVNEMLDKIKRYSARAFSNPKKTFIDPACGTGNFLIEVLRRKIAAGSSPTMALMTIYGMELLRDNTGVCRKRLLEIAGNTKTHETIVRLNIVCGDALKDETYARFVDWELNDFRPLSFVVMDKNDRIYLLGVQGKDDLEKETIIQELSDKESIALQKGAISAVPTGAMINEFFVNRTQSRKRYVD